MRYLFSLIFLFLTQFSNAQKIYGTVYNSTGDLMPSSSVLIKGSTKGTVTNSSGKFILNLSPGNYTITCHQFGYASQEKKITINKDDSIELTFVLSIPKFYHKEVVGRKYEDASFSIIRNAIQKRSFYLQQMKAYEYNLCEKKSLKIEPSIFFVPDKKKLRDSTLSSKQVNIGTLFLDENVATLSFQSPNKQYKEIKSSHIFGTNSFGFDFATQINFYQNNVSVFTSQTNPRGFISPIADNAMHYYIYRFMGCYFENGKEINSILVIPKRRYEPLFFGIINIVENSWQIYSTNFFLTKSSQLELLDSCTISQMYVPVNDSVSVLQNQSLHVRLHQNQIGIEGNFISSFSDYNLNPEFKKNHFGNTVIKYIVENNSDDSLNKISPILLDENEINTLRFAIALKPEDRKKIDRKISALGISKNIFWKGLYLNPETSSHSLKFSPILKGLEYNPAEGFVTNLEISYEKKITKFSDLSIKPSARYGFANRHLDPAMEINLIRKNAETWNVSFGKRVSQFDKEGPITPLVNSISTLIYGDNLMKTYENSFGSATYAKNYNNGFKFSINGLFENRTPLNNVTDFVLFKQNESNITPNYPTDKLSSQFTPHQAFIFNAEASFQPGQKFIEYPNSKIFLVSKYPTFIFDYSKGMKNIFGSDVDFDKWNFTINGDQNFKLAGILNYKIAVGGFLNTKAVYIQDYQHFNGNLSVIAGEYMNSFQLSSYYANSTTAALYGILHLEHHFNGLLTNKIPGLKKWNWYLVVGTNSFYVNPQSNHLEFFVGLENILKTFRVDWVTAYEKGKPVRSNIIIGYSRNNGGSQARKESVY